MKVILSSVLFFFAILFLNAQTPLSSMQWKEDVRYLQDKIHSDYSPLFKKVTPEKFDKAVDDLVANIPTMKDHQIIVGIAELVALFEYGHTALWLTAWRYNQIVDFHQMPYNLYQFKEGVYVQGVHKDYKKAIGARVVKVGNVPIAEAMEKIKPVVSSENDQFFKAYGLNYLGVPEVLHANGIINDMSSVTLTLEKDNSQFEVEFSPRASESFPGSYGFIEADDNWIEARNLENTPLWLKNFEKKYFYEYLKEDKILYVRQSEIQDDDEKNIPQFYDEVFQFVDDNEVEKFILDVRLNGGGNNYKNKAVVTGLIKSEKINKQGKLFVVLGRRTFSACQNLVNELENYTNATFIGEPTAENVNFFGDNRTETLPNSKLAIRLSYLWWQNKDPRDTRPWTPPHIAVDLSIDDYINNVDPVIEMIKNSEGSVKTIDPWAHIIELFEQGKMEELVKKAHEYVKDPTYSYFDFENRINEAGYSFLGNNQLETAIAVFSLNAELFPKSANSWDSLAEAYWKNGSVEKAKEYYNKAINLDPDGKTGENAKRMLDKIASSK